MVEVELKYDASTTVVHADAEGVVATSATCKVYKPDGTELSTAVVTLPTASTTTAVGTTATALVLASAVGFSVGLPIAVTSDGVVYVSRIARLDGTTAYLIDALPVVVDTGSTVKATQISAVVAAPGVANIGAGYRIVWAYSSGAESRQASYQAAVVRWPWFAPVAGADVRSTLANTFQERKSEAFCDRVAAVVNDRIRSAILRTGRRPWLYLSPLVFDEAARQGIRYALAEEGVYPGGDAIAAMRELRFAFDDAMAQALTAAAYDSNASGTVDETTPNAGSIYTMQAVR